MPRCRVWESGTDARNAPGNAVCAGIGGRLRGGGTSHRRVQPCCWALPCHPKHPPASDCAASAARPRQDAQLCPHLRADPPAVEAPRCRKGGAAGRHLDEHPWTNAGRPPPPLALRPSAAPTGPAAAAAADHAPAHGAPATCRRCPAAAPGDAPRRSLALCRLALCACARHASRSHARLRWRLPLRWPERQCLQLLLAHAPWCQSHASERKPRSPHVAGLPWHAPPRLPARWPAHASCPVRAPPSPPPSTPRGCTTLVTVPEVPPNGGGPSRD
eukprot:scaffold6749_cov114-Isochrysis_galbana.AAC.3